jgi:hypothetical protein
MSYLRNTLIIIAGAAVLSGIGTTLFTGSPNSLQLPAPSHSPLLAQAQGLPGLSLGIGTYNIDEPGRIAYQSTVSKEGQCNTGNTCFFEFGFVPQGHRIVIKRISGTNVFTGQPIQVSINANNGSGLPIASFTGSTTSVTSVYDHLTDLYYDAGQLLEVQVTGFNVSFFGSNAVQVVTLSGYELNCMTTACSPIAH